jgi:hypothetical protein
MSVEILKDEVTKSRHDRVLEYAVTPAEFRWVFDSFGSARKLLQREYLMMCGVSIVTLQKGLKENFFESPDDFRPSLELLSGTVNMTICSRRIDRCSMLLPSEAHPPSSWLGDISLRLMEDQQEIELCPLSPNILAVGIPKLIAQNYDGEAIYEEVARAFTAFSQEV